MVGVTYAGAHCVATTKGIFPATLTVGQSGGIGEYVCYTNSTKTSSIGKRVLEYSTTQGDSAEKINFKVSESYYDATGKLNSREGTTYTITVGGLATIGQYFIQSSGSTTLDLVGQ